MAGLTCLIDKQQGNPPRLIDAFPAWIDFFLQEIPGQARNDVGF